MKKLIIASFVFLFSGLLLQAQDMEKVLKETLEKLKTDSTTAMWASTANRLEMIAGKWSDKWVTHYYAAYAFVIEAYMEPDKTRKDALLDKADQQLDLATKAMGKDDDETLVLKAMAANARMAVDPANRWQQYGQTFNDNIQKAKSINPNNPRIYYLQGTSLFFTPKAYGGGEKAAQPYFEKADGLFSSLQDTTDIMKPWWGKAQNDMYLEKCKEVKE